MEQGEKEQQIIRQAMQFRRPLPKAIRDAPELQLGLEVYWDAFWDLSTCRQAGFGAGPIPWMSIRDYGLTYEFDEEQLDDLFHHVRLMDNEFLKFYDKQKPK